MRLVVGGRPFASWTPALALVVLLLTQGAFASVAGFSEVDAQAGLRDAGGDAGVSSSAEDVRLQDILDGLVGVPHEAVDEGPVSREPAPAVAPQVEPFSRPSLPVGTDLGPDGTGPLESVEAQWDRLRDLGGILALGKADVQVAGGETVQGQWPPEAWDAGEVGRMSTLELAMIVAGATPAEEYVVESLQHQLLSLDLYPSEYRDVARITLEGLVAAKWHQEQAVRGLSEREREALFASEPGTPSDRVAARAMAKVDGQHLMQALASLNGASVQILDRLDQAKADLREGPIRGGFAEALLDSVHFMGPYPQVVPSAGPVAPELLLDRLLLISGVQGDSVDRARALAALQDAPPEGLDALALIVDALVPLAEGSVSDPDLHLVRVGDAADQAREILEIWSAMALVKQVVDPEVDIRLPSPSTELPPLLWGLPQYTRGPLPAVDEDLATAVHGVAGLFVEPAYADELRDQAEDLQNSILPEHAKALARVLVFQKEFLEAQKRLDAVEAPFELSVREVEDWLDTLEDGGLLSPDDPAVERLLGSVPVFEAQRQVAAARERMLRAAQELVTLVPASQMSASSQSSSASDPLQDTVLCEGNDTSRRIAFILAFDPCGEDNHWTVDVMLSVDLGGDDRYDQRAGAPFIYDSRDDISVPLGLNPAPVAIPLNILVDIGGSDTYDAQGADCAQAAACNERSAHGQDPTNASYHFPTSILVDWQEDDEQASNTFRAGAKSQAYASPGLAGGDSLYQSDGSIYDPKAYALQSLAVLVERTGEDSRLSSFYQAGDQSQSSSVNFPVINDNNGGSTSLIRLVGSRSESESGFTAGNWSQAAGQGPSILPKGSLEPMSAFLNIAGEGAISHDEYIAGTASQGYSSRNTGRAMFVDLVGHSGQSDDRYVAGDLSRGAVSLPPAFQSTGSDWQTSLFLDAVAPRIALVGESDAVQVDGEGARPDAIRFAPAMGSERVSNDVYEGPIQPGRGYGMTGGLSGRFIDIGGDDTYALEEPLWDGVESHDRPRNDGDWGAALGSTGGAGIDIGIHDEDQDAYPSFLEQLWPLWESDANDARYAPTPSRMVFILDGVYDQVLDGPHIAVVTLGGDDRYLSNFSAAFHVDANGMDTYLGRPGAAGSVALDGNGGSSDPSDPPLSQHQVSFLLDMSGNDTYDSTYPRTQGYGSAGGIGILLDGGGDDLYHAPHSAQGVGQGGPVPGIGVLVDLGHPPPMGNDYNTFRSDGPPSQGDGEYGILVATGAHNTFDDFDPTADNGRRNVNLGINEAPEIDADSFRIEELASDGTVVGEVAKEELQVGIPYRFHADVRDVEGDDLRLCWTFEFGDDDEPDWTNTTRSCTTSVGTSRDGSWRQGHAEFTWDAAHNAISDWNVPGRQTSVNHTIRLEVFDTGNRAADPPAQWNATIRNQPPDFGGCTTGSCIRGATEVFQMDVGAYQVPFTITDDLRAPVIQVDWGDGSPKWSSTGDSVDFASVDLGGSVRLPEAVPKVVGGELREIQSDVNNPPSNAIDGDNSTFASFQFIPQDYPAVHLFIDFEGPRHIGRIELDGLATLDSTLSIEGIDPQGRPSPEGIIQAGPNGMSGPILLPDMPLYQGILIRQLVPQLPQDPDEYEDAIQRMTVLRFNEVRVLGPGAWHTWASPGVFHMDYTVIDAYGGRNSTQETIRVVPDPSLIPLEVDDESTGEIAGMPIRLNDVGGRGLVRHASVPTVPGGLTYATSIDDPPSGGEAVNREDDRTVFFTLDSVEQAQGTRLKIDWGDGSSDEIDPLPSGTNANPSTFSIGHQWQSPGDYLVTVTYYDNAGNPNEQPLTWIHAENAFTLTRYDSEGPQRSGDPLLFLALDQAEADRTTWYTGLMPLAVVDAAGNDRYFDAVAVPRYVGQAQGAPSTSNNVPMSPSLIVDASGNDDYMSLVPETQGFGRNAAVALLVDASGDDRYTAPGMAQGAASKMGAAMLVDLGGDDVWNPVPAYLDAARTVPHPALAEAHPKWWSPWSPDDIHAVPAATGQIIHPRPPVLEAASRAALLPTDADLIQGAAEDGIGILVANGGHDVFNARQKAQGFARHDPQVQEFLDYVVPNDDCLDNPGATAAPPSTAGRQRSPNHPQDIVVVNHPLLCALGVFDAGLSGVPAGGGWGAFDPVLSDRSGHDRATGVPWPPRSPVWAGTRPAHQRRRPRVLPCGPGCPRGIHGICARCPGGHGWRLHRHSR